VFRFDLGLRMGGRGASTAVRHQNDAPRGAHENAIAPKLTTLASSMFQCS
jgi:hypothetical protein